MTTEAAAEQMMDLLDRVFPPDQSSSLGTWTSQEPCSTKQAWSDGTLNIGVWTHQSGCRPEPCDSYDPLEDHVIPELVLAGV